MAKITQTEASMFQEFWAAQRDTLGKERSKLGDMCVVLWSRYEDTKTKSDMQGNREAGEAADTPTERAGVRAAPIGGDGNVTVIRGRTVGGIRAPKLRGISERECCRS